MLFATTHRAGQLVEAFTQFGKVIHHGIHAGLPVRSGLQPTAEFKIFLNGHLGEKLPSLRHQGHAGLNDLMGFFGQVIAIEQDLAAHRYLAGQGAQKRGFAGAIRSQNDRQSGQNVKVQIANHFKGPVPCRQTAHLELGFS